MQWEHFSEKGVINFGVNIKRHKENKNVLTLVSK